MEAGKAADAYGLFPGHDVQCADGESAYTQALLGGKPTYIRLPPDRWPESWKNKFRDPVCPLRLALYGHPDAGGFWEQHCDKALRAVGFTPVGGRTGKLCQHCQKPIEEMQEWKSNYMHDKLQLVLVDND